jgi:hypothetical protein
MVDENTYSEYCVKWYEDIDTYWLTSDNYGSETLAEELTSTVNELQNTINILSPEDTTNSVSEDTAGSSSAGSTGSASSDTVASVVKKVKENYYGIQNNLSDFTEEDGGSGTTRYLDANGTIRKIVAPVGTYDEDMYYDSSNYSAEYYYDENGIPSFVFVYLGTEYYRFYLSDWLCFRYIDSSGNIYDYEDGVSSDEISNISDVGYFCNLASMELHWAGVG